jgi:hypothetical protein
MTPEKVDEIGQGRVWIGGIARQWGWSIASAGSTMPSPSRPARRI